MFLRDYLQRIHGISRRKIIDAINQGNVLLNGKKVENYKEEVLGGENLIIKNFSINENISLNSLDLPPLLIFNKPIGYTCSKNDAYNKTIYELLPHEFKKHYYYIGRLDKNSRGLMLLTTDPTLVNFYEHPSKEIEKSYYVTLNCPFDWELKKSILNGIHDDGEFLRTKSLEEIKGKNTILKITLNEGKKRHIRRIFHSLGYNVIDLQRVSIGPYSLGNLKEGEYNIASI